MESRADIAEGTVTDLKAGIDDITGFNKLEILLICWRNHKISKALFPCDNHISPHKDIWGLREKSKLLFSYGYTSSSSFQNRS